MLAPGQCPGGVCTPDAAPVHRWEAIADEPDGFALMLNGRQVGSYRPSSRTYDSSTLHPSHTVKEIRRYVLPRPPIRRNLLCKSRTVLTKVGTRLPNQMNRRSASACHRHPHPRRLTH